MNTSADRLQPGFNFTPLVDEPSGGWGPSAQCCFKQLARSLAGQPGIEAAVALKQHRHLFGCSCAGLTPGPFSVEMRAGASLALILLFCSECFGRHRHYQRHWYASLLLRCCVAGFPIFVSSSLVFVVCLVCVCVRVCVCLWRSVGVCVCVCVFVHVVLRGRCCVLGLVFVGCVLAA